MKCYQACTVIYSTSFEGVETGAGHYGYCRKGQKANSRRLGRRTRSCGDSTHLWPCICGRLSSRPKTHGSQCQAKQQTEQETLRPPTQRSSCPPHASVGIFIIITGRLGRPGPHARALVEMSQQTFLDTCARTDCAEKVL